MTLPSGTRDAAGDPVQIQLGPSAAGRCRRRIHLDAASAGRRTELSAAARRAFDEVAEHRSQVLAQLEAAHTIAPASGSSERGDLQEWRTRPRPVVISPQMATPARSGSADLLIWVHDGYVPVIVRAHRTREPGGGASWSPLLRPLAMAVDPAHRSRRNRSDRLALAHHYRQLVELGCASSTARGGVIGRGGPTDGGGREPTDGGDTGGPDPGPVGAAATGTLRSPNPDDGAVIIWHDLAAPGPAVLDDYDRRFADRTAVALAAVTGGPALARPSRVAECRRCPWWPRCSAELVQTGDISLLLVGGDVDAARAAGVHTVADLAALPRESLPALPFTVGQAAQAQVRARAWLRGAPLVRLGPRAAVTRADVEVDVDAESYGEDGAYLWGALLSGADVGLPKGYRSFVTWEPLPSPAQGVAFGDFFQYLMQVRDAAQRSGLGFAVTCYAKAAEERWMLGLARRYAGLPGVPDAREVAAFCASPQWVDLMAEIKRHFVLPGSLRLKELAASVGFSWRDPEPGGENSMAWYRVAVDASAAQAPSMAERVLRYNEDDVRATRAVRSWITEHLDELPTVAELTAEQNS